MASYSVDIIETVKYYGTLLGQRVDLVAFTVDAEFEHGNTYSCRVPSGGIFINATVLESKVNGPYHSPLYDQNRYYFDSDIAPQSYGVYILKKNRYTANTGFNYGAANVEKGFTDLSTNSRTGLCLGIDRKGDMIFSYYIFNPNTQLPYEYREATDAAFGSFRGTVNAGLGGEYSRYISDVLKRVFAAAQDISGATVAVNPPYFLYDGSAKTPEVTVRLNNAVLTEGTDYTVSYENNTELGVATATAVGTGIYTGSRSAPFFIVDTLPAGFDANSFVHGLAAGRQLKGWATRNTGGGFPEPAGSVTLTENGTYNVKAKAEAVVSVPGIVPAGSISFTANGTYDVTDKAQAVVDVAGGAGVPVTYKAYLKSPSGDSTAGPYIDTGVAGNALYGIRFVFRPTSLNTGWQSYVSAVIDNFTFGSAYRMQGLYLRWRGLEKMYVDNNVISTAYLNEVTLNNGTLTVNGTQRGTYDASLPCSDRSEHVLAFACGNENGETARHSGMQLYELALFGQDGAALRRFVPATRDSDGAPGLYDLVNGSFYANAGTGSFTAGSNA